jgi:hypothetical protein
MRITGGGRIAVIDVTAIGHKDDVDCAPLGFPYLVYFFVLLLPSNFFHLPSLVHPEGVPARLPKRILKTGGRAGEPPTSISTEVRERSEANFIVEMRIPPLGGTSER